MTTDSFTWIDRPEQLTRVAQALESAPWIALDSEANSMFVYRERVCLLQLNAGGECFLIDTLALAGEFEGQSPALDLLKPALEDRARVKYLHGGEYDVGILKRDFGLQLAGVWDSQQASSLLGWERTGYGAVAERICGVALDKAWAQYDWGTRPIDAAPLRYALDDVLYLPRICEELRKLVREADIEEELALANLAIEDSVWTGGFDPAGVWRIKGARLLAESRLSVLHALHAWRDRAARAANFPPGRLINNELLLALARSAPATLDELKRMRVRNSILTAHGDDLVATIRKARNEPAALPPAPAHREVTAAERERETRLKEWRRIEAERRKVTLQVVLPARSLEYLKRNGAANLAEVPQLGARRIARYGEALRAICAEA